MVKKKEVDKEVHHHYDVGFPDSVFRALAKLFFLVLLFILLANLFSTMNSVLIEDQTVYNHCLDTCKERNYMGYKIGEDIQEDNPFVVEHDRSKCVKVCSDTYLRIRGV